MAPGHRPDRLIGFSGQLGCGGVGTYHTPWWVRPSYSSGDSPGALLSPGAASTRGRLWALPFPSWPLFLVVLCLPAASWCKLPVT